MDKNTRKILNFFNAHSNEMYSASTVYKMFPNFLTKDILEIIHYLCDNGYLRIIKDNLYQSTNKGKTYKAVSRSNWISKHIVAILALVVSVLAFIESTISLIISILK